VSHLKPPLHPCLSFLWSQGTLSVQAFIYHLSQINSQGLSDTKINHLVVEGPLQSSMPVVAHH